MFKKTPSKAAINRATYVDDLSSVVQKIDATLVGEIYSRRSDLLASEDPMHSLSNALDL